MTKEKFKVMHNVFDEFTNLTLLKLISKGYIDGLESTLYVGKEANIFTALREGKRVIAKIYRLETCDFNRMYDYIKYDPRYQGLKKKKRKIIFSWVQREFRNLMKARQAGVRVPMPITFLNNVLVIEFIGKDEIALKLKDSIPKNKKKFFNEIIDNMKKLYKDGLVHADLSSFNILNFNEEPVFIDMSQATTTEDVRSKEYLERDINNIITFFNKLKIKINKEKTWNFITK